MDVFAQYEEAFLEETRSVTNLISKFNYDKTPAEKQAALGNAKQSLRKAEGKLKQMETLTRDMDAGNRNQLRSKLSQYKKSMTSLRSDIDRAQEQGERDMVLGGMSVRAAKEMCLKYHSAVCVTVCVCHIRASEGFMLAHFALADLATRDVVSCFTLIGGWCACRVVRVGMG